MPARLRGRRRGALMGPTCLSWAGGHMDPPPPPPPPPPPSPLQCSATDLQPLHGVSLDPGQAAAALEAPQPGFSLTMGLSYLLRLAFWVSLLTVLPIQTGTARVSSSLSTTHHVHHFHNKHGTVPIAINRMPFLTRGGHGKAPPLVLKVYI